jgi:Tfp pilus assembly protein PilV
MTMKCGVPNRREGLTLVETCIAVLVFGIAVAGICALVLQNRQASDMARDHYVAANIARNRLEKAKQFNFSAVASFRETAQSVDIAGNRVSSNAAMFIRSTTITNVLGYTNLLSLIVTVQIRDRNTRTYRGESETIQTYLADLK